MDAKSKRAFFIARDCPTYCSIYQWRRIYRSPPKGRRVGFESSPGSGCRNLYLFALGLDPT